MKIFCISFFVVSCLLAFVGVVFAMAGVLHMLVLCAPLLLCVVGYDFYKMACNCDIDTRKYIKPYHVDRY